MHATPIQSMQICTITKMFLTVFGLYIFWVGDFLFPGIS